MALKGKLENEVEIKAPADKFFSIFSSQGHKLPGISSDKVHNVELHKGDFETEGSVKSWSYTLEGKKLTVKETVEKINEVNKSITFNILEGDHVTKHYKVFKVIIQAIPKNEGEAVVKLTVEYEKITEDAPTPNAYLDFATNVTKDVEAHLLGA